MLVFAAIVNVVRIAGLVKVPQITNDFPVDEKGHTKFKKLRYLKIFPIKLSMLVFSIKLNTVNTTNIRNPPKCLQNSKFKRNSLKFKNHSIKQAKISKKNKICPLHFIMILSMENNTHVHILRVSLCQEKTLNNVSFNGHSHL